MIDEAQLVSQILAAGLLESEKIDEARRLAEVNGEPLYDVLLDRRMIDEHRLVKAVSQLLNVPSVRLRGQKLDSAVARLVPASLARRNRALPLRMLEEDGQSLLLLAMADPLDMLAMDEISSHTGVNIRPVIAGPLDLEQAMNSLYPDAEVAGLADAIFAELEDIEDEAFGLFEAPPANKQADKQADKQAGSELANDELAANGPTAGQPAKAGGPAKRDVDSWDALFEGDGNVGIDEDSSVISQEMRDRPPADVFEAVAAGEPEAGDISILGTINNPSGADLAHSSRISLTQWELDDVFEDDLDDAPALSIDSVLEDSAPEDAGNADDTGDADDTGNADDSTGADDAGDAEDGEDSSAQPAPVALARIQPRRISVPADMLDSGAQLTREIRESDLFDLAAAPPAPPPLPGGLEEHTATAEGEARLELERLAGQLREPGATHTVDVEVDGDAASASASQAGGDRITAIPHAELLQATVRLLIARGIFSLEELLVELSRNT